MIDRWQTGTYKTLSIIREVQFKSTVSEMPHRPNKWLNYEMDFGLRALWEGAQCRYTPALLGVPGNGTAAVQSSSEVSREVRRALSRSRSSPTPGHLPWRNEGLFMLTQKPGHKCWQQLC